jgi:branched-chain amino acid transport system substrate-binding protein
MVVCLVFLQFPMARGYRRTESTEAREPSIVKRILGHPVVRTIGLVATAASVLAACSSSSTGGSSKTTAASTGGGSSSSSAAKPAPTGSPIKLGLIVELTGAQASSGSQGGTVAPAWAKWVNANGGINGHPVEVITADDGGDPAKAQAAEKKLVDQDNVLAIVVATDTLVGVYDAAAVKSGVALVGGTSNGADWFQKAGMFAPTTDVVSGVIDQMLVAKQVGHAKHFANLYCAEAAACSQATGLQQPQAAKIGLKYSAASVSATATSYTAECLKLQQSGADYLQLNIAAAVGAKFIQDCQAQNYNPTWGTSEQAIGPELLKVKNATMYGPAYVFPSVASSPAVTAFTDAMKKYAKDDNWHEGSASYTWIGYELIRKALANATASPTRADVLAGLNSIKDDDLGGLVPNKVTFTAGKAVPFGGHPCSFVVGIKNGKTIAPNGLTPLCPTA